MPGFFRLPLKTVLGDQPKPGKEAPQKKAAPKGKENR